MRDGLGVQLHRLAPQEVLYLDILNRGQTDLTVDQLIKAGQDPQTASGQLTDVQDLCLLLMRSCGNGKDDLGNLIFFGCIYNAAAVSYNAYTIHVFPNFCRIVINHAAQVAFNTLTGANFSGQNTAGISGADKHNTLVAVVQCGQIGAEDQEKAEKASLSHQADNLEDEHNKPDAFWEIQVKKSTQKERGSKRQKHGDNHT